MINIASGLARAANRVLTEFLTDTDSFSAEQQPGSSSSNNSSLRIKDDHRKKERGELTCVETDGRQKLIGRLIKTGKQLKRITIRCMC